MDSLQEQHEEYVALISESGVPLWVLDYYWYGMSNPETPSHENETN